jgi:hypothetical protein
VTPEDERTLDTVDGLFFDRQGQPISLRRWSELLEGPIGYRLVGLTFLSNRLVVSTVWLGLVTPPNIDPPRIFETMVFGPRPRARDRKGNGRVRYSWGAPQDAWRSATEEEARTLHRNVVAAFHPMRWKR